MIKTQFASRVAIVTTYLAPTNTKPSRVKASANGFSITRSWEYGWNTMDNHTQCALALMATKEWEWDIAGAWIDGNKAVFVEVKEGN